MKQNNTKSETTPVVFILIMFSLLAGITLYVFSIHPALT